MSARVLSAYQQRQLEIRPIVPDQMSHQNRMFHLGHVFIVPYVISIEHSATCGRYMFCICSSVDDMRMSKIWISGGVAFNSLICVMCTLCKYVQLMFSMLLAWLVVIGTRPFRWMPAFLIFDSFGITDCTCSIWTICINWDGFEKWFSVLILCNAG